MEKSGDIVLSYNELLAIRKRVEEKFQKQNAGVDLAKLWRTNPESYNSLRTMILAETGADVSTRFLSKCLYHSLKSGKYTSFRLKNIDIIYRFAWGQSRETFFTTASQYLSDGRKHSLFYITDEKENEEKIKKEIVTNIGSPQNFFLEVKHRYNVITSSLLTKASDKNEVIHLY